MERFLTNLLPVSSKSETLPMLLNDRVRFSIFVLIVFYTIGLIGILIPIHPDFVFLTPYNLLLSLAVIIWGHSSWKLSTILVFLTCFLVGFGIEVVGVNTGLIFGEYAYGPVLGLKLWDTPLMIGINWLLLIYGAGVTINRFMGDYHWAIRAILAAGIMVILDLLIEPVAIAYDFWTWESESVPFQNYFAWFLIALFLQLIFMRGLANATNKVGIVLLVLQFIFFGIINLSLIL